MYESAFDIVASFMRYFFILLILYILIRLITQSFAEFKSVQQIKKHLRGVTPGYVEIIEPASIKGTKLPLLMENTLGRGKRCTVNINHPSVAPLHAFIYAKKKGLLLSDYSGGHKVFLNDNLVKKQEQLLYPGDEIRLGEVKLILYLNGMEPLDEGAEDNAY